MDTKQTEKPKRPQRPPALRKGWVELDILTICMWTAYHLRHISSATSEQGELYAQLDVIKLSSDLMMPLGLWLHVSGRALEHERDRMMVELVESGHWAMMNEKGEMSPKQVARALTIMKKKLEKSNGN